MHESPPLATLERRIDYSFQDPDLLLRALTHRSFLHEAPAERTPCGDYESLEFLGDAVVGMIVSETLFKTYPEKPEGDLSKMKAALVSRRQLARLAGSLELGNFARLSKGESLSGGHKKAAILADLFESLTGAIYLDGGLDSARRFVRKMLDPTLSRIYREGFEHSNYKSILQEALHRENRPNPVYKLAAEEGPSHAPSFSTQVFVGEQLVARGSGKTKKAAEQDAAETALRTLGLLDGSGHTGKRPDKKDDEHVEESMSEDRTLDPPPSEIEAS